MLAAQQLLDKVEMQRPILVQSIKQLSEAYIELAYYSVSHLRKQQHGIILCNFHYCVYTLTVAVPVQLPPSCKLVKLSCLNEVAVPTVDIKVCCAAL